MFTIRNKSDANLNKQIKVVTISKQNQRSSSEAKQDSLHKPNYHFTQKREMSEGKNKSITLNQPNLETQDIKVPQLAQTQNQAKQLDFRLPDLRKYQQKPPKPVPSANKNEDREIITSIKEENKPSLVLQKQMKQQRLIMYDDGQVKNKMPQIKRKISDPKINTSNQVINQVYNPNQVVNQVVESSLVGQKLYTLNVASLSKAGFDGQQVKTNQDRDIVHLKTKQNGSFVVLDGHGMDGEKVSQYCSDILRGIVIDKIFQDLLTQLNQFDFLNIFLDLHKKLQQNQSFGSQFSGTTCTVGILKDNVFECGWVGDSRSILGRKRITSKKIEAIEITHDHKPNNEGEKQRIERSGGQVDSYHSATGAPLGPSRVWVRGAAYPGLAMSRSLGDQVAASVGVSQIPDVTRIQITEDDLFIIIASDGVWEFMSNQEVVDLVYQFYLKNDAKGACQQLYTDAHKSWKQVDDGVDDITSVIIFLNRE